MGRRPATVSSLLAFRQLLIILGALAGADKRAARRGSRADSETVRARVSSSCPPVFRQVEPMHRGEKQGQVESSPCLPWQGTAGRSGLPTPRPRRPPAPALQPRCPPSRARPPRLPPVAEQRRRRPPPPRRLQQTKEFHRRQVILQTACWCAPATCPIRTH